MDIHTSLAAWPGIHHEQATSLAFSLADTGALAEPLFGRLSLDHVQLVPQSFGRLTERVAAELREAYPASRFRLHANVRVLKHHRFADLSGYWRHYDWFEQAARVSRQLCAPAYSAHSGMRSEASFAEMIDNARRCEELFEAPVAIEGQYPTRDDRFLVSSWNEYQLLLESGANYAIDLSHLNILAHQSGRREKALIAEMLSCDRCLEVHVSDNDGRGDQHRLCHEPPWWFDLLKHVHTDAVVFTEGNQRQWLRN